MSRLRPLFASVLLAVAFLGTAAAPAVHWAGHGLDGHGAPVDAADEVARDASDERAEAPDKHAHAGECPDCALIQKVLGSEFSALPLYASVVALARSISPPEAPAVQTGVATPEERGPPMTA